ncbi:flavodoxin family protein [Clostridium taeniosporum]|uniref:Flavodoxin n=1 Tax=Clostridium taeniosporum TaxID=394958 RepID=A0A1D7XKD5_9CLOT|nr:flavodoxin [Clostridium taeniosporum]AOR23808.1 flavodoxin [Clostridium taeniosporum]
MKSLVVFYSLEGNTKLIANIIAEKLNADILELMPEKVYFNSGFKKFLWGGKSVIFKEKPKLKNNEINIEDYKNIFIGTPIWVGTYAPPFNTFLDMYNIQNKNIGLFACHGGGGASKFFKNVKKKIPNNNFIGEIDFFEPIKNDKDENIEKAIKWIDKIIM